VGSCHHKLKCRCRTSPRRPRARICLRKGCGQKYEPRRWNQLYCQDAECLRQMRRWQAARRQARRRLDAAAKAKDAAAQRARRERGESSQTPNPTEVAVARCHAAKILLPSVWCDRPGCYEPPLKSAGKPACFCGPACRQAVHRVLDRERKWRLRGTFQGRQGRKQEYAAARERQSKEQPNTGDAMPSRGPPP
jgi:hypothetical protein